MKQIVQTNFHGVEYSLETGRMARQAHGAVIARAGDTVVLATAVGKEKVSAVQDFFPLTVDYTEKMYAVGKIPGGFFKREGRPSTEQILVSRLIDRPIRPLFPEGYFNDLHVTVSVLSYDGVNPTDTLSIVAASAALSISPAPFQGPVGAVTVGLIDGKFIINPSPEQAEKSDLALIVAGTKEAIMMVESGANFISEEKMLEALEYAHQEIKKLIVLQEDLVKVAGKPKWDLHLKLVPADLQKEVDGLITEKMNAAIRVDGKLEKYAAIDALSEELHETMLKKLGEQEYEAQKEFITLAFGAVESKVVRTAIVKDKFRADKRTITEIRPITCETNILPNVHGSALFTRGETQSLGIATLGTGKDEQIIDGLEDEVKKKFYLHYNFPSFSVGEIGGRPGPGRREVGHGMLAERALRYALPEHNKFPYTIRVVSEILESNGSSSMASVCSGSMSMMQAGVPLKAPIAGIAMGLIKEKEDFVVLTDIAGIEDHLGDMDFKVAGSKDGITALQMDIKITGVSFEIMKQALAQAKKARFEILETMNSAIAGVSELADNAPRIESIKINPEKIGELIGPGGKMIKAIQAESGATIEISEDGEVKIFSSNGESLKAAKAMVESIVVPPVVGNKYKGKVVKITTFGAFLELTKGTEALLHISKIAKERVNNVEDYLKVGDMVDVQIEAIDDRGRINLVRTDLE